MKKFLLAAMFAAVTAAPMAAQVLTVTSGPPTDFVTPVGKDSDFGTIPTALAQTFMPAPGFNYLQMFSFFISEGISGGGALQLSASVYAFDTDHITGSALFTSDPFLGTDALSFQEIFFGSSEHPLNIFLPSGGMYAVVLSSLDRYATTPDHSTITVGAGGDIYPAGALLYSTDTDPADLSAAGAFADAGGLEAAATATFSSDRVVGTPEPSTVAMLATGLIPLGAGVRRRRRAA